MLSLLVDNRENAEYWLTKTKLVNLVALVSCHGPQQPVCKGFEEFAGPKLETFFEDSDPGDTFLGESAATLEQVKEVVDWGHTIQEFSGTVMVHCNAGVGRSPAVAFILQCLWDGVTVHEDRSLQKALSRCTTGPMPNEWVVKLGDELLGRDRAMLWAAQSFNDSIRATKMY